MDNQQVSYTEETFIQHPKYPNLEVGSFGTIKYFNTDEVIPTSLNAQDYLTISHKVDGKSKTLKIHRLVAEIHLEPPSEELRLKCLKEHHKVVLVRHLDNNKTNNRFDNLGWCDLKTNTQQAWNDGLIPRLKGELNGRAVLSEELVHKLCKDFQEGMMPKASCKKYGISMQQATKIRAGYQWKHISCQYDIKVNKRVKTSTISQ